MGPVCCPKAHQQSASRYIAQLHCSGTCCICHHVCLRQNIFIQDWQLSVLSAVRLRLHGCMNSFLLRASEGANAARGTSKLGAPCQNSQLPTTYPMLLKDHQSLVCIRSIYVVYETLADKRRPTWMYAAGLSVLRTTISFATCQHRCAWSMVASGCIPKDLILQWMTCGMRMTAALARQIHKLSRQ